jgi:hypothetical protein
MIAPNEDSPAGGGRSLLLTGSLASAAKETLASLVAVIKLLGVVGDQAVTDGVGKPLVAYQTLLRTYQTLLEAENALKVTVAQIIDVAEEEGGGVP